MRKYLAKKLGYVPKSELDKIKNMPNTNKEKTWEEEFDNRLEKLISLDTLWHSAWESDAPKERLREIETAMINKQKELKNFISILLKEQEEKHKQKIKGMVKEIRNISNPYCNEGNERITELCDELLKNQHSKRI